MVSLPAKIKRNSGKADVGKRSSGHRTFVRKHGCCVPGCAATYIECAHVRNGTDGGTGQKPSDKWCISLCGGPEGHHAEQHRIGEPSFAKQYGIDLKALAMAFLAASPHRSKLA